MKYKDGTAQGSLASAAQLGSLARYIRTLLEKLGTAVRQGSICANPLYRNAEDNSCAYCPYAEACGFEDGRGGEAFRFMEKKNDAEFWQAIGEGEDNG